VTQNEATRNEIGPFMETTRCYEFIEAYLPHLGRVSPYIFRFPSPLSKRQLQILGDRSRRLIETNCTGSPVHMIGIASRGIPMAVATLLADNDNQTRMSTTDTQGSVEHVAREMGQCYTVMMDNSITTGRTVARVVEQLASVKIIPDLVIRFFDREELDAHGEDPTLAAESVINCPIASVFRLRDLVESDDRKNERALLTMYARNHGTRAIQNFLDERPSA
jgi:orotate phosphoribosyltransferase